MRTIFVLLLLLAGGLVAVLDFGVADDYLPIDRISAEPFIKAELRRTGDPQTLGAEVEEALDAGEYDDAEGYAEIADYLGVALPEAAQKKLDAARAPGVRLVEQTGSFFEGFLTGEGSDAASFAGAITSDLTVVGDVRDISTEGPKMLQGEPYSEFILGLSVVGLGVTSVAIASGGVGLPARVGVSILKVAKRAGTLTASFTRELTKMTREAVNFPALTKTLQGLRLDDAQATRRAVSAYAENLKGARLFPVLGQMDALQRAVGPAESVRLLKYVENSRDLENLVKMSQVTGKKTRGVIGLTGRTSLRAFKSTFNLLRLAVDYIASVVIGLLSLVFLVLFGRRRRRRRRRT